jgi:hypothetical protein
MPRTAPPGCLRIAFDEPLRFDGPKNQVDSLFVAQIASHVRARQQALDDRTAEGAGWGR